MAVGPGTLPEFHPVAGVKIGIASAGIKKPGRKDVVVFELASGSRVAGINGHNRQCGGVKVICALIQFMRGQPVHQPDHRIERIVGAVRISRMPLHARDRDARIH